MNLLTKGHLVVAKAASTDATRFVLNSVYLEEAEDGIRATATDGRILATVEDKAGMAQKVADYPANVIPTNAPGGAKAAIVPVEAFVSAFKNIPKRCSLPILETVIVSLGGKETVMGTTDLASPLVRTVRNIDGTYPNYDQVIPKKSEFFIRFDPKLLAVGLKIAQDFGLACADMAFTTAAAPVKITGERNGQTLTVVVMPMRS